MQYSLNPGSFAKPHHACPQRLANGLGVTRAALGLGAGDLKATAAGEHGATIEMPNVIFVDRKVLAIEKLISVKPERTS
jgi:hypothetical protein